MKKKQSSDSIATNNYVDRGLWANKPVLPAVVEATRHMHAPLHRIDVLSLGTLQTELDLSGKLGGGKLTCGWD